MGEGENNVQMYAVGDGKYEPLCKIEEIEFKPVKHRKISKKRFIKLYMAHGFSRNEARRLANNIVDNLRITSELNELYKDIGFNHRTEIISFADAVPMSW